MATAKTYQSLPMCLPKGACENVLASVVQHRHVAVFEGEVAAVVLFDGDVLQTTSDKKKNRGDVRRNISGGCTYCCLDSPSLLVRSLPPRDPWCGCFWISFSTAT